MLRCVNRFLARNPEWKLRVLGEGQEIVRKAVSGWPKSVAGRVEIEGQVSHGRVVDLLADSKIFFMPSIAEGFSIAAAEAACMGCTIVGTPLESFEFLTANGFSGTLSEGFASRQISKALEFDIAKHGQGAYDPVEIARHWRFKLSIDQVSAQIYEIIGKLLRPIGTDQTE
jgi:glycosyltransferase involved in cell wall biosynthesis